MEFYYTQNNFTTVRKTKSITEKAASYVIMRLQLTWYAIMYHLCCLRTAFMN